MSFDSLGVNFIRWLSIFVIISFIIGSAGCGEDSAQDLPQILAITPDDGSINIPLNTNIVVTFERPMDADTIGNSSFTLSIGEENINSSVTYNTSTFTAILNPSQNLDPETTYTANLTRDIKDTDGNPLIREYSWAFTTAASLPQDDIPPTFEGATGAISTGSSTIVLSWSPAIDNDTPVEEIIYLIYSATIPDAEDYTIPAYTSAPGVNTYIAAGLDVDTPYYFVVRARDKSGNISQTIKEVFAATNP